MVVRQPVPHAAVAEIESDVVLLDGLDELTTVLFYWNAPPAPFLPESIHGQKVVIIAACYAATAQAGETVVAPIRALKPAVDMLAPMPYTGLQFDPLFPKGIYSYAKSDYFDDIPPAMVDDMIEWAERKPAPLSLTHLNHFGGAMGRVANDRTPFAHRDATFAFSQDAFWETPKQTDANVQWVKDRRCARIRHGLTSTSWRTRAKTGCARATGATTTVWYTSSASTTSLICFD